MNDRISVSKWKWVWKWDLKSIKSNQEKSVKLYILFVVCMQFAAELQIPKDPGMFMGLFWSACVHAFTHAEAHPPPSFNNHSTH